MKERPVDPQYQDQTCVFAADRVNSLDGLLSTASPSPITLQPPQQDLGTLSALPTEILQQILPNLDLQTLFAFRKVNRRAFELVESLPAYKHITQHAPTTIQGILRIKTGKWITLNSLYSELCEPNCERCGSYGGYMYLLTASRVCLTCVTNIAEYCPLPREQAKLKYGLDDEALRTTAHMTVIPGEYSWIKRKVTARVVYDDRAAYEAGIALHGSWLKMNLHVAEIQEKQYQILEMDSEERIGEVVYTAMASPDAVVRFAALIRAPWFDLGKQEVEWGFHCIACANTPRSQYLPRMKAVFDSEGFRRHLEELGGIRDGEHRVEL